MRKPREPKQICGAHTEKGPCRQPAGARTDHPGDGKCWLHGGRTPIKHGRYSRIKRPRLAELIASFGEETDEEAVRLRWELDLLRGLIVDYVERYDEQTDALLAWHASFGPAFDRQYSEWQAAFILWQGQWSDFQKGFAEYRTSVEAAQSHYALGWPYPPAVPVLIEPPAPPLPEETAIRPRRVTDILEVGKFIQSIGALTERIEKRQQAGTITLSTLDEVLQKHGVEAAQAAAEVIHDDALRTALLDAIGRRWGAIIMPAGGGAANSSR